MASIAGRRPHVGARANLGATTLGRTCAPPSSLCAGRGRVRGAAPPRPAGTQACARKTCARQRTHTQLLLLLAASHTRLRHRRRRTGCAHVAACFRKRQWAARGRQARTLRPAALCARGRAARRVCRVCALAGLVCRAAATHAGRTRRRHRSRRAHFSQFSARSLARAHRPNLSGGGGTSGRRPRASAAPSRRWCTGRAGRLARGARVQPAAPKDL